jgi:hypothetical protein
MILSYDNIVKISLRKLSFVPRALSRTHSSPRESQNAALCSTRTGKQTTPHNHPVHNNVAIHDRPAHTPGPARAKKDTTTTPPDPSTSTPTGLAWNQSTGSAWELKPQTRPRPPQLELSFVAAAGAGGQAHQRRWAGSLSCVLRAVARSSRPAPRNKVRLPRLLNLFYRSITTSHPSTFIQIPITHHPNSNNEVSHPSIHRPHHVPVQFHGYLGSRWASAAPVGLPATRLKSARRGRRWPPPSGEMPATLSLRNSPREEAPLAFPGYTALRRKSPKLKLTTFFSVEAPCFTSTVPSPPSTKVAREGIATPGQSTKHPSQLNHPCSHSQACMPSVRSKCSPPTPPGQPGH